jgi:hypothetical protein
VPDFLGIGAHMAGTMWWRGLLGAHPQVDLRPAGHDGLDTFFEPFCTRPMTDADVSVYRARFERRDRQLCGEWSDRYLYNTWMLPLLKRAAPDAKLLLVTRDPIDRYRTTLGYRLGEGGNPSGVIHMTEAFHRGRYASQLRALERFFDRDRVLVQQYEQCVRDPLGEYRRMLRFLGLDEDVVPSALNKPPKAPDEVRFGLLRRLLRRTVPVRAELWPDIEAALATALTDEVRDMGDRIDVSLWPSFAHLAGQADGR